MSVMLLASRTVSLFPSTVLWMVSIYLRISELICSTSTSFSSSLAPFFEVGPEEAVMLAIILLCLICSLNYFLAIKIFSSFSLLISYWFSIYPPIIILFRWSYCVVISIASWISWVLNMLFKFYSSKSAKICINWSGSSKRISSS